MLKKIFLIPGFDRLHVLQMSETEGNKQTFYMAAAWAWQRRPGRFVDIYRLLISGSSNVVL